MQRLAKRAITIASGGATALTLALAPIPAADAAPLADATFYVSINGDNSNTGASCADGFATVAHAIAVAAALDTVVVCPSSTPYVQGNIAVSKSLTLRGMGHPVIDATGQGAGILVEADNVTVGGLRIEHGVTGILVLSSHDAITGNSTMDEARGIELSSASFVHVIGNVVTRNLIGIHLVGKSGGPCTHDLVANNVVNGNSGTAAILLEGDGAEVSGVFDNRVIGNVVEHNGIAVPDTTAATAGTATSGIELVNAFDNLVAYNQVQVNGGPGISVLAVEGGDASGNVITQNALGINNVNAVQLEPAAKVNRASAASRVMAAVRKAPQPAPDTRTTAIFLSSQTSQTIVVLHNVISGDFYGIWATSTFGPKLPFLYNLFLGVLVPVHIEPQS